VPTTLPHPTAHTVPPPVLFNTWKHHAGWVRGRIAEAASGGDAGLKELADEVVVTGTKLMDFYTGELSPSAVAERVLDQLQAAGLSEFEPFERWVQDAGGYRMLTLPDDGSRWVLRLGEGERYVHLHTARYSPHSLRVPGVSLKTAIVANALAQTRGRRVADLDTVNDARRTFLGLPPVAKLTADGGLGEVLELLAAKG
jgi:hypothetical protein